METLRPWEILWKPHLKPQDRQYTETYTWESKNGSEGASANSKSRFFFSVWIDRCWPIFPSKKCLNHIRAPGTKYGEAEWSVLNLDQIIFQVSQIHKFKKVKTNASIILGSHHTNMTWSRCPNLRWSDCSYWSCNTCPTSIYCKFFLL